MIPWGLARRIEGLRSRIRIWGLRRCGMQIGAECRFESIRVRFAENISVGEGTALTAGCWLWPAETSAGRGRIRVGRRVFLNRDVMLDACGLIEIGDDCMFGPGVYVTDGDHRRGEAERLAEGGMTVRPVRIGKNCWLGAHAVVLKGVELGDGCVVGAGAVVTRSFPAGSVIVGNPARVKG